MTYEEQWIEDYSKLKEKNLWDKYQRKMPDTVTIESILNEAKVNNKLEVFIDPIWYGDKRDDRFHFLLKNKEGKFEVFISERGHKDWLTVFDSLEEAVKSKLDLIISSLKSK
jgi:hypothetical protein